jgi:hypothetical protein
METGPSLFGSVTCNIRGVGVNERVRDYRRRMRERGYRPVQIWVPDVGTAAFAAEAYRQSLLVAEADRGTDDQDFIEAVTAAWDDEPVGDE